MGPYPPLRLYRIPFSTNVERVALALAHKGIEVEWIDVDPDDRSEVVRVSGQELVPVLVDGDRVLTDSPVILEYLEQRFPERPLYPADPARRAELRTVRRLVQSCLEAAAEPDRRRGGEGRARSRSDRRARAADRRRAAALRGPARRTRLPVRRRALRRGRRRVPVSQVRGALGGRRRGPLPRGAARYAARSTVATRASKPGSTGSTRCRGRKQKAGRKSAAAPSCG